MAILVSTPRNFVIKKSRAFPLKGRTDAPASPGLVHNPRTLQEALQIDGHVIVPSSAKRLEKRTARFSIPPGKRKHLMHRFETLDQIHVFRLRDPINSGLEMVLQRVGYRQGMKHIAQRTEFHQQDPEVSHA